VHAALARATGGVSPAAVWLAWLDWALHLAGSPGKQAALAQRISQQSQVGFTGLFPRLSEDSDPPFNDPRFKDPDWNRWPFNLLRDTFLQTESFWQEATTDLPGVSPHHEHVVSFAARQYRHALPQQLLVAQPRSAAGDRRDGRTQLRRRRSPLSR
jgi:polyhydroxyalkanoate synthase